MENQAVKTKMGIVDHPHHPKKVHFVLAHSYFIYFFLFLVGVALDLIFQFKMFQTEIAVPTGVGVSILGSLLVFWAQSTSRTLKKENLVMKDFYRGPYKYTRSPTHLGLFLLLLGFSIIADAFFIALFTVASFFVTKFTFLKKQEEILFKKYGAPYREYAKIVRF